MKKNKLLILFALLINGFLSSAQTPGYVNFTFLDACTGSTIPNGYQFNFRSSGNPGAFYAMYPSGGWHAYTPATPDMIGCGYVQSANTLFANVTSVNPSNSWCPTPPGFIDNYTVYVDLNGGNFTLNGQTHAGVPPNVTLCSGTTASLNMDNTGGVFTQYEILAQKGTYSGSTFTPVGSPATTGTVSSTTVPDVNLVTLFPSYGLGTYNGYLRVELKTTNCLGTRTRTQIFNILGPSGTTNFAVNGVAANNAPPFEQITSCQAFSFTNSSSTTGIQSYQLQLYTCNTAGTPGSEVPFGTGMSGSGAGPSTLNLKTAAFFGSNPAPAHYVLILRNTYCGLGAVQEKRHYIRVLPTLNAVFTSLNVNGGTSTGAPTTVYRCTSLPLSFSANQVGVVNYTVTVAKGTYSGGFVQSSVSSPANFTTSGPSISHDLFSVFSAYLSGYTGVLQVRVQGTNICSTVGSTYFVNINLQNATNLSSGSFNVNGLTSGTQYMCQTPSLKLNASYSGTSTWFDVVVEKGAYVGSVWTPVVGGTYSQTVMTAPPANFELMNVPGVSAGLAGYTGMIQVRLSINGPCNSLAALKRDYTLSPVTDLIDYKMKDNGCSGSTGKLLATSLPIANQTFTVMTDMCGVIGWQGAFSAGVVGVVPTTGSSILSHGIDIDEVNPSSGAFISSLSTYSSAGAPPLNYDFGAPTSGYFLTNHAVLSTTNRTFRVRVTIVTAQCTTSKISYFRIAGGSGSMFWKETNSLEELNEGMDEIVSVYPNPASSQLNVSVNKKDEQSKVTILNITGQVLITQQLTENITPVNISELPAGNYIYKINIGGADHVGKFVKQ